jgi:hypothetical protein
VSTRRESWYWCTFTSKDHQLAGAVHAWSARAAVQQFEADVRAVTDEPGKLSVEPGFGGLEAEDDASVLAVQP